MAKQNENRQPLPAGTVIEYCCEQAEVVRDSGGDRLEVAVDGCRQRWWWTLEGVSCSVVSLPTHTQAR